MNKPNCPKCNAKHVSFRSRKQEYVCGTCGCRYTKDTINFEGTGKRRCPECHVYSSIYRSRTNDYACKSCGCIYEILPEVPE